MAPGTIQSSAGALGSANRPRPIVTPHSVIAPRIAFLRRRTFVLGVHHVKEHARVVRAEAVVERAVDEEDRPGRDAVHDVLDGDQRLGPLPLDLRERHAHDQRRGPLQQREVLEPRRHEHQERRQNVHHAHRRAAVGALRDDDVNQPLARRQRFARCGSQCTSGLRMAACVSERDLLACVRRMTY